MKFTGTNILYTPQVPQINYLFKGIVVNSTGVYSFVTNQSLPFVPSGNSSSLFQLSGNQIIDPSGRFISTYNTGESFSISGWVNYPTNNRYLVINSIVNSTLESNTNSVLNSLSIICPTGANLSCDIKIYSPPVTTNVSFSNFTVDGLTTGNISTDTCMYAQGGSMVFYQSYESLITGAPLLGYVDTRFPNILFYSDNDTSFCDDTFKFNYYFDTSYAQVISTILLNRTGLYNSGITIFSDLTTDTGIFSGLFNGFWSGSGFYYQDTPSTNVFNYQLSLSDDAGNPYPKIGYYSISIPSLSTMVTANYITGFQLTASGEYLTPPNIQVTNYFYSTGIQQNLSTLLFSSGCTGNLPVYFSGISGMGTGASGYLTLFAVLFSGVYSTGFQQFNLVSQYISLNNGTGYIIPPKAFVNTGIYGSSCFDVPNTSGLNYSWFSPFRTFGATQVEAGYFTGVPLCTTGLVSGGALTGYIVTGINVYNIGTGYNTGLLPTITFLRQDIPTGLTKNASGVLYLKTGTMVNLSNWSVYTGIAGYGLSLAPMSSSIYMDQFTNYLTIQLSCSGLDISVPISGTITMNMSNMFLYSNFFYSKYFSTDPGFLKKNSNPLVVYSTTANLSFSLLQSDLDNLYSSAGYTDNNWPFQLGDFDF